nr:uncharacterized protein LOC129261207 [Lytechinus pictus]
MNVLLQTDSKAKGSRKSSIKMAPPLYQSRRRRLDQTNSDTNYNIFYNIKKTKLSARYPFLPKKQIERKIKHLWERASAEKRAVLCLTSSGSTAKSPFKGSILQGLCKKKLPLEHIISNSAHIHNSTPTTSMAGSGPVRTLHSSMKDPWSRTSRKQTLRSSSKKHVSTTRVSFNFDQSPLPPRPNTRSSIKEQKSEERKVEKNKRMKHISTKDGHLRKRELSFEEKQMYEFQDEGSKSWNHSVGKAQAESGRLSHSNPGIKEHVFAPEQYNIESSANTNIFTVDSQSPTITPDQRPTETTLNDKSSQNLGKKTKTSIRRNTKSLKNSNRRLQKSKDVKNNPHIGEKGKKKDGPSTVGNLDSSQSDDALEVPWLVSAHRDSSSDDARDDSSDDQDQDAFYDYYHKSSSESSAPTVPSLSQESDDAGPSENNTMFSWNGACFTKKTSSLGIDTFDSQLSQVSMDAAEVMSVSSTEASLSSDSPQFIFGLPGEMMMSSPRGSVTQTDIRADSPMLQNQEMHLEDGMMMESLKKSGRQRDCHPSPDIREDLVPQKRKRRLQDGILMDSPKSSRLQQDSQISPDMREDSAVPQKRKMRLQDGMKMDSPKSSKLQGLVSPTSRKRQMKGLEGEDMVSMTTARNTKENQIQVSPPKTVASREDSVVSNERKVLVEMNSKPTKPATKTNSTERNKEDHAPKVQKRTSGRLKNKESLVNRSSAKEGCTDEGGNIAQEIKKTQTTEQEEILMSDGILCDLFQPNLSSEKRSFNPSGETEFYQSCMDDPVSSHLFLEENFFL